MLLLEGLFAEVLRQCSVEKKESPSHWHLTWSREHWVTFAGGSFQSPKVTRVWRCVYSMSVLKINSILTGINLESKASHNSLAPALQNYPFGCLNHCQHYQSCFQPPHRPAHRVFIKEVLSLENPGSIYTFTKLAVFWGRVFLFCHHKYQNFKYHPWFSKEVKVKGWVTNTSYSYRGCISVLARAHKCLVEHGRAQVWAALLTTFQTLWSWGKTAAAARTLIFWRSNE